MPRKRLNLLAESLERLRSESRTPRPAYHCEPSRNKVQSVLMSALGASTVRRADPSGQLKPCLLLTAIVRADKRFTIGMRFNLKEAHRLATDMLARHRRLCDHKRKRRLVERMGLDAEYFDAVAAGDWLYCKSAWIGGGICEAEWFGPGDERNRGTCISGGKIPQLNVNGIFARSRRQAVTKIIAALSDRLRHLSITCGDWSRIFFPSLMQKHRCGIFLDPPYAHSTGRDKTLYRIEMESTDGVAEFCRRHGKKKNVRIVLAGLDGEYDLPGWRVIPWSASHCFGRDEKSGKRHLERLWISPHCQPVDVADAPHRHTKGARWRPRSKPGSKPVRRHRERSSSRPR